MVLFLALLPLAHADEACVAWDEPTLIGEVDDAPFAESSGLAALRSRPGIFLTHDDSGGARELYAFEPGGRYVGLHEVPEAAFIDWEALSAGPCPPSVQSEGGPERCLYIGDVGDNPGVRPWISVYVVAEPAEGADAVVLRTWHATWPDEVPLNAEALFVHPRTGRIYLVSKTHEGSSTFAKWAHDPADGATTPLEKVGEYMFDMDRSNTTGGDWDPTGSRLVVRTYDRFHIWVTDPCAPDAHWDRAPDLALEVAEGQGEAVTFTLEGDILSTSEGMPMTITTATCNARTEVPDCPDDTGGSDSGDSGGPDSGGEDSGGPDSGGEDSGGSDSGGSDSGGDSSDVDIVDGALSGEGCLSRQRRGCGSGAALFLLLLPGLRRRAAAQPHQAQAQQA